MNETREFDLADVLSITTDLLGFMTGEQLWTHQLPRAAQAMGPVLIEQHPWLADLVAPDSGKADLFEWLTRVEADYPGPVTVTAAPDRFRPQNPLTELVERLGPERVIPVVLP